jgi:hypothetical protein
MNRCQCLVRVLSSKTLTLLPAFEEEREKSYDGGPSSSTAPNGHAIDQQTLRHYSPTKPGAGPGAVHLDWDDFGIVEKTNFYASANIRGTTIGLLFSLVFYIISLFLFSFFGIESMTGGFQLRGWQQVSTYTDNAVSVLLPVTFSDMGAWPPLIFILVTWISLLSRSFAGDVKHARSSNGQGPTRGDNRAINIVTFLFMIIFPILNIILSVTLGMNPYFVLLLTLPLPMAIYLGFWWIMSSPLTARNGQGEQQGSSEVVASKEGSKIHKRAVFLRYLESHTASMPKPRTWDQAYWNRNW